MNVNFSCFDPHLSRVDVTDEVWTLKDDQDRDGVIVIASFLLLFMLVGVPWNLTVLAALIYNKFFKHPSTFLLFNLAMVDLLTCALVIPFQAVPGLHGGVYNLGSSDYRRCQACQTGVILVGFLLYMSMHLIALMSVDRLIYIMKPLDYEKWITVPRMVVVVIVLWVLSFILAIPPLFQFGAIGFSQYVGTCSTIFGATTPVGPSYLYILFLVLEAMIPLGVLIVANIWLLYFVRKGIDKRFKNTYQDTGDAIKEVNLQAKKKYIAQQIRMAKVFGSIFISNFITCSPAIVVIFVVASAGIDNVPASAFVLVFLSFLSQSVIHPMLESCLGGTIRKLVKKVCCTCSVYCTRKESVNVTKVSSVS